MTGMTRRALTVAALGLLVAAGTATALRVRAGDLILEAHGGFAPTALPKHRDAPIAIHGGGKLSTVSGELPPVVEDLVIEFDRHGSVQTAGLPVCTHRRLVATTVAAARRNCSGAIVGRGFGSAIVALPEQRPIPVSSPITLFNGPKKHGDDTVIAHAHLDYPAPATFIVPVVIERIHHGVYGYRTKARIPRIAGGYGHPISGSLKIGRRWTFKGRRHSYVNARCETGHLQARAEVTFKKEGPGVRSLTGTFVRPCTVRR